MFERKGSNWHLSTATTPSPRPCALLRISRRSRRPIRFLRSTAVVPMHGWRNENAEGRDCVPRSRCEFSGYLVHHETGCLTGRNFCCVLLCDTIISFSALLLKCFYLCASTKCHNGGLSFCCRGMGIVGKDAMTVPDYLAVGFLLVMPLIAARWFAQRKFELFPTGSDTQRRSP